MEYVDGLADKAGARSQLQLEPLQGEEDVLDIGLDVHDEDESLPSQTAAAAPPDPGDTFFSLFAAMQLIPWTWNGPPHLLQRSHRDSRGFISPRSRPQSSTVYPCSQTLSPS
ncbi:hypothetical protein ILYODFUR_035585 [Ilyodon furcidens]|uniref:Uncharacterized protein n=1 Tax=Ilyodon furcidens TaxID=33524 RepID=A0ABV0V0T5_9TELE